MERISEENNGGHLYLNKLQNLFSLQTRPEM